MPRFSQGLLLDTPFTRKLTLRELEEAKEQEEKLLCFNFRPGADSGRNRIIVHRFSTAEECAEYVAKLEGLELSTKLLFNLQYGRGLTGMALVEELVRIREREDLKVAK